MSDAFATIWRPGSGTQWVRWGMSGDEFKAQDTTYFDQGLRVTSLAIRNGKLAAVWQPGTGTQWMHWGMSGDEFKAQDTTYFGQGLRVTVAGDRGRQDSRRSGVRAPARSGCAGACRATSSRRRTRPTSTRACASPRSSSRRENRRGVASRHAARSGCAGACPVGDFAAQDRTYFAEGLRITSLAIEGGKYAAVWRPGAGTQWWSSRRGVVDFKTEDAAYFAAGSDRLPRPRRTIRSAPTATRGRAACPTRRRPGQQQPVGSHNGSQAFAFDFGLPAGTEIRAARGGTVEWLQENLTATYNPNAADRAGQHAVPHGSLQNWGNAVRIRHAGGFTSWYFHIQTNGVLVNVGDEVTQGQVDRASDNTGRSSGAHLHFQVQADSVDWGQSVRMHVRRELRSSRQGRVRDVRQRRVSRPLVDLVGEYKRGLVESKNQAVCTNRAE